MPLEAQALEAFPREVDVSFSLVADAVAAADRILVVLDDDPTGTQSVAGVPVLTRWEPSDFAWAFDYIRDGKLAPAVYVLTNTRSLDEADARARNEQIVRNALEAAESTGQRIVFVSRGDSTLRGHFPLEPDTIAATVQNVTGQSTDGVVIVPAFPDAGRITVGGVHYCRVPGGDGEEGVTLVPAAETEFARDATFGYASSQLADYVDEKSGGRIPADSVLVLTLDNVRSAGAKEDPSAVGRAIADALEPAENGAAIVVDIVTENDLRLLSLGLMEAEARGKNFIYRVGPPFVRARIGQNVRSPLSSEEVFSAKDVPDRGGLIVVGSHVGLTSRQLAVLKTRHLSAQTIEIDVPSLLDARDGGEHLNDVVEQISRALVEGDVIVHTSRTLIKADDAAASLTIARRVSAAVVSVVNRTLKSTPPRFVIAKGGITSSDVAAFGLEIRRALVRGPMLPGIVSLWEAVDGPAQGIPFVVFAGNVGDDDSLAVVVDKLSSVGRGVRFAPPIQVTASSRTAGCPNKSRECNP